MIFSWEDEVGGLRFQNTPGEGHHHHHILKMTLAGVKTMYSL